MAACPYDRRFFNWGAPPTPPEARWAHYSPEHQVPAKLGTVMKCDFCPDMMRAGVLPYCVQACPNRAIYYGDLEEDVASNGKDLMVFSRFLSENQAYRLKEDKGTKPRGVLHRGPRRSRGARCVQAGSTANPVAVDRAHQGSQDVETVGGPTSRQVSAGQTAPSHGGAADWRERLEKTVLAPVTGTSRAYYLWVAFLLLVIAWGVYAYSVQLRDGLSSQECGTAFHGGCTSRPSCSSSGSATPEPSFRRSCGFPRLAGGHPSRAWLSLSLPCR